MMEGMLREVERSARSAQADAITAHLMLLSAVRKVEAAERLGLDLSAPDAAACFSTLDDMVSWVERPPPAVSQQRPALPPPPQKQYK